MSALLPEADIKLILSKADITMLYSFFAYYGNVTIVYRTNSDANNRNSKAAQQLTNV